MSAVSREIDVSATAAALLHSFRDKFDFSDADHYGKMADHAYLASEAFHDKKDARLIAAKAKDEAAAKKEAKP